MAAKGQAAKQQVAATILEAFGENAFTYDKEIRVNMVENGEPVQIKITLTAAKALVDAGGDSALPGAGTNVAAASGDGFPTPTEKKTVQATESEKQAVADLMASLGL